MSPHSGSLREYLRHEKGDFEGAADAYRRLLKLDPHHANAAYNLALSLHALGKWAEAASMFQSALTADSARIEAELGLGACRLHLHALAPALDAFERCLRQRKDWIEAQVNATLGVLESRRVGYRANRLRASSGHPP